RVTLTYANGAKVIVGQGEKDIPGGCTFVGEKGQIFVDRSKITASDPEILKTDLSSAAVRLYKSDNHVQDFLNCIASRDLPAADVEIGHRTATACHLANMAARLGRKIEWDPSAEKVVGDEDAAAMADRPYRGPWKLA
ncbi:MAG: gfo/Idh/MocA family oxidoreductase, partial [Pirellulaceae bacterium]|nr:gfo/Idh/MocA family oxidoreductase [Pirellulaceae bacterium]